MAVDAVSLKQGQKGQQGRKIMRRLLPTFLATVLLLAGISPLSAGWLPVGGPVRPVITLQLDPSQPDLLYARVTASEDARGGYLWRSEDAGATWRDVQPGLEHTIDALAIDPENPRVIWAWTSEGELWRSDDAGNTWSQRPAQAIQLPPRVVQLLIDPRHPSTLYRAELDTFPTVAVSRDGGATFREGPPLAKYLSTFNFLIAHPDRDELLAFTERGFLVSTDGGQSWSVRGHLRNFGFVRGALAPSAHDILYGVSSSNQCLARSDDGGSHWQVLTYPPRLPSAHSNCYDVAIDPRDARHVWVAAQVLEINRRANLLFESKNGGASWSGPFTEPGFGVVAAGGERIYTGGPDSALYASTDGGRTWTAADRGIAAGDLRHGLIAQRPPGGGAGRRVMALNLSPDGSTYDLYRSDGGQSWLKTPLRPVTIAGAGGSIVLAVDGNAVMRSRDGGATWTVVPSGPPLGQAFRSDPIQPRYAALLAFEQIAIGNIALWTSDDAGATWRRSSDGLPIACSHIASVDVCPEFPAYAVDPFNPSRRWVSSTQAFQSMPQLFLSEDAGTTWSLATADLQRTLALAADPTIPGRLLAGTEGGLFVSTDGGLHWSPLGDLPAGAEIDQLARDPFSASWYAATLDRGIYRSLDGGAHWTLLDGAPDRDSPTIAVDPRRPTALLAAFAGQGLWRWTP
jgi:photosystem II stability/assembly factor-like uncharacterized protein